MLTKTPRAPFAGRKYQTARVALVHMPEIGFDPEFSFFSYDTPEVLLVLDQDMKFWSWKFPGGKLKSGETVWQSADREFSEETGTYLPDLKQLYATDVRAWEIGGWKRIFLGLTKGKGRPVHIVDNFHTSEIAAVKWFPIDKLPMTGNEASALGCRASQSSLEQFTAVLKKHKHVLDKTECFRSFEKFLQEIE